MTQKMTSLKCGGGEYVATYGEPDFRTLQDVLHENGILHKRVAELGKALSEFVSVADADGLFCDNWGRLNIALDEARAALQRAGVQS